MKAERVVLDTNILISAALRPTGPPRAVLESVRSENGVLLFSEETFDELRNSILRPKFDRYVDRSEIPILSPSAFASLRAGR